MDQFLKEILWHQFGASIDMHTLFYLDYYLSETTENFLPPEPFTLSELDPSGAMPDRTYTKEELLTYVKYGKQKCRDLIAGLTAERAEKRFINEYRNYSIPEILIYNMRHVQHHAAQLNLLLRQGGYTPPKWVSQTKESL